MSKWCVFFEVPRRHRHLSKRDKISNLVQCEMDVAEATPVFDGKGSHFMGPSPAEGAPWPDTPGGPTFGLNPPGAVIVPPPPPPPYVPPAAETTMCSPLCCNIL